MPSLLPAETCVLSLTSSVEMCLMAIPSVVWRLFIGCVYLAKLLILFQGACSFSYLRESVPFPLYIHACIS
jgi:hypothetical protein